MMARRKGTALPLGQLRLWCLSDVVEADRWSTLTAGLLEISNGYLSLLMMSSGRGD